MAKRADRDPYGNPSGPYLDKDKLKERRTLTFLCVTICLGLSLFPFLLSYIQRYLLYHGIELYEKYSPFVLLLSFFIGFIYLFAASFMMIKFGFKKKIYLPPVITYFCFNILSSMVTFPSDLPPAYTIYNICSLAYSILSTIIYLIAPLLLLCFRTQIANNTKLCFAVSIGYSFLIRLILWGSGTVANILLAKILDYYR